MIEDSSYLFNGLYVDDIVEKKIIDRSSQLNLESW